jgi:hypothetical protein
MCALVNSVIPFGIATPNQFGTTLSAMANSMVVTSTVLPKKPRLPGGGTELGTTSQLEFWNVPVPSCTPAIGASGIDVSV